MSLKLSTTATTITMTESPVKSECLEEKITLKLEESEPQASTSVKSESVNSNTPVPSSSTNFSETKSSILVKKEEDNHKEEEEETIITPMNFGKDSHDRRLSIYQRFCWNAFQR